jgi:AcrR family transcriptional regulator
MRNQILTERSGNIMDTPEIEPTNNPTAVKIVDAAGKLFMQRGYTAVSITDIIKAAGITKPTLYYYFPDKEELFVQTGLRELAYMGERLRDAAARSPEISGKLHALAQVMMDPRTGDMRMMRHEMFEHLGHAQQMRLARAFQSQLFRPVEQVMQLGLEQGILNRYNAATLAAMFIGMAESFSEFIPPQVQNEWEASAEASYTKVTLSVQALIDLFLHGVQVSS